MKLSRRSFFGLLSGAAIGGKAALKEAAAKAAEGLALSPPGMMPGGMSIGSAGVTRADTSWATASLRKLADETLLSERKAGFQVTRLDPDLASSRSMSLSVKMLIQRDRDFKRSIESEKSYLERTISGFWQ